MTPTLAFVVLLATFVAWVLLPFIPALRELARPRDAAPLTGVGNDAGELTFFAEGFRRYAQEIGMLDELDMRYGAPLASPDESPRFDPLTSFALRDGTNVRVLRSMTAARSLVNVEGRPRTGDRAPDDLLDIIVIDVPADLPEHLSVDREVYARAEVVGGEHLRLRALLAARSVRLARHTTVVRWLHAEGTLHVASDSWLFGRATSATEIRLARNVHFERIAAPRIFVGDDSDEFVPPPTQDELGGEPWTPPANVNITDMSPDTRRVHGNLIVPGGSIVSGNLVVTGALVLEPGAQLHGSAKAMRGIQLVGNNIVTGALSARNDIHIGERSRVAGPIVSETLIHLHAHSYVGSPSNRSTVTAPSVRLSRGTTTYGTIAARERGVTG